MSIYTIRIFTEYNFLVSQGSVETLIQVKWKTFTLLCGKFIPGIVHSSHTRCYQNKQRFVKDMTKKFGLLFSATWLRCLKETATDYVMLTFIKRRQHTSGEPSTSSTGTNDGCAIFIDDSYIFIEGQKFYAGHLNLQVLQDPRCRIHIGKLLDLALDGRPMSSGKLYGSEPPPRDTVWNKIREQKLDVQVRRKDSKGKEKEVDTSMTADAVEYVCLEQERNKTVIIVAGDRDFRPIVDKIFKIKPDWKVEVLAFSSSIAKPLKDIENKNFEFIELESLLQKDADTFFFIEASWRPELSRHKSMPPTIILSFKQPLISPKASEDEKIKVNKQLKQYAEQITRITRVPCFYYLCNEGSNAGRWVYIIGYTREKAAPTGGGIDFFSECSKNARELDETCSSICELYKEYMNAQGDLQPQNIGDDDSATEDA